MSLLRIVLSGLLCLLSANATAWVLDVGTSATRRLFLQVGDGVSDVSQWATVSAVNRVSLSVPATQLGTGQTQPMTSDSSQSRSAYNGNTVCSPPAQVYVGAAFQRTDTTQTEIATLQVTSPSNLINPAGDQIAFSQISWTTSALGSTQPNIIPPGAFNGSTQTLVSFNAGTMVENCHTFHYANSVMPAAGVYTGRVTYTLSAP